MFYFFSSHEFLFDIYSLHGVVKEYEHENSEIQEEEVKKWLKMYRHPLVVMNIN